MATPGQSWRLRAVEASEVFEAENRGIFDELVVDQWLHIEQMEADTWWMRVGDSSITVKVDANGKVSVVIERNVY